MDKYFANLKSNSESIKSNSSDLQNQLEAIRKDLLFPTFHSLILNSQTRETTLKYMSEILRRNKERSQLQSDERHVSGDGFLMNLMSILQMLSIKIKRDKIEPLYQFHPQSLVILKKDESRIKNTSTDAEKWLDEMTSNEGYQWSVPNFTTECFFLALHCHHLSVIPCQRKYIRRIRAIRDMSRYIEELQQSTRNLPWLPPNHHNRLKRLKEQLKKLQKAKACSESGLIDERLFGSISGLL